MRQITGLMEEYWRLRGLEIAVPSFGQLSELLRDAGGPGAAALSAGGRLWPTAKRSA